MAKMNPSEYAAKWKNRTTSAIPDFVSGVQKVTEAPGMRAAQRADAMVQGVQAAVQSGKWQRNVGGVSLESWKNSTATLGAQRIGSGVAQAEGKMQQFASKLIPFQETLKATLDAQMPRGDFEQNVQRMTSWARGMHEFDNS